MLLEKVSHEVNKGHWRSKIEETLTLSRILTRTLTLTNYTSKWSSWRMLLEKVSHEVNKGHWRSKIEETLTLSRILTRTLTLTNHTSKWSFWRVLLEKVSHQVNKGHWRSKIFIDCLSFYGMIKYKSNVAKETVSTFWHLRFFKNIEKKIIELKNIFYLLLQNRAHLSDLGFWYIDESEFTQLRLSKKFQDYSWNSKTV